MSNYPAPKSLAEIIAMIAHFATDDFRLEVDEMPEASKWTAAYICAGFLAQHTVIGTNGVDTEWPLKELRIGEDIPYSVRVSHARFMAAQLGGESYVR